MSSGRASVVKSRSAVVVEPAGHGVAHHPADQIETEPGGLETGRQRVHLIDQGLQPGGDHGRSAVPAGSLEDRRVSASVLAFGPARIGETATPIAGHGRPRWVQNSRGEER